MSGVSVLPDGGAYTILIVASRELKFVTKVSSGRLRGVS
jgi:hypothetical protein